MKVDAKVYKFEMDHLKGFASITLDGAFVVGGLSIREGHNGLFVSMPQRKGKDGKYVDESFPLSRELREQINKAVLDKYNGIQGDVAEPAEDDDGLPF